MTVDTVALQSLLTRANNDHEYYGDQTPFSNELLRNMAEALQQGDSRTALARLLIKTLKESDPSAARFTFAHWWANQYGRLQWSNARNGYVLADPDAITWWSFLTAEELMLALDTLLQKYPEQFVLELDRNFDRSLAVGLKAYFVHRRSVNRQIGAKIVTNLIHRAAMRISEPRYLDAELFAGFSPQQQREFIHKHEGGTLRQLTVYCLRLGTAFEFVKFQRKVFGRYVEEELMNEFISLLSDGTLAAKLGTAETIMFRLRIELQKRGFVPYLAVIGDKSFMGIEPSCTVKLHGITYAPNKESSRRLDTVCSGAIIEVWLRPLKVGEPTPEGIVFTTFWQV